jgi:hypothetical protein
MLVVFSLYAYLLGDTEVSVFSRAIASSCQEWSNSSVRFKILAHVNKQSSLYLPINKFLLLIEFLKICRLLLHTLWDLRQFVQAIPLCTIHSFVHGKYKMFIRSVDYRGKESVNYKVLRLHLSVE